MNIVLVLDNIRSIHNVGSIFRTADAAGVTHIYLCGITPSPVDRFGDWVGQFVKVSLGSEQTVPWESCADTKATIDKLNAEGCEVLALEQSSSSVPYMQYTPQKKNIALVVGNEVDGLSRSLIDACAASLEIPMRGSFVRDASHPHHSKTGKESLNVSVALGIVLFSLIEKRG